MTVELLAFHSQTFLWDSHFISAIVDWFTCVEYWFVGTRSIDFSVFTIDIFFTKLENRLILDISILSTNSNARMKKY